MKANEGNNPISPKLQQFRRDREIGSCNRLAVASILDKLRGLQPAADGCQSQHKQLVGGLFNIIAEAQRRLLSLTGAPGIISQGELERVITARDTWCYNRLHGLPAEFPAAWGPFLHKLSQLINDRWLVEPGQFFAGQDRTGVVAMGDRQENRPRPLRHDPGAPRVPRGPRQASAAPGIITQAELQAGVDAYKAWKASGAVEYPPPYIEESKIRNEKFEAGWEIEPGKWGMRIGEDGTFWIFNRQFQSLPTTPHAPRPDTPTPAQLQVWFDLPSDRLPAESSPAAS